MECQKFCYNDIDDFVECDMTLKIEKLGNTFFAVVNGVDAREPTAPEDVSAIIDAIDDYGVLLFPG